MHTSKTIKAMPSGQNGSASDAHRKDFGEKK